MPAPRRLCLSSQAPQSKPGSLLLPRQLVIGRADCRFSRFDLKSIPLKRRRQALQLQLNQWAPYPQAAFAIVFDADAALVWCWDQSWLTAQRSALPPAWRSAQALPESVLCAAHTHGVRLLQCIDGVEAQSWQDGELRASRWWPQPPALDDYLSFCREVGHAVSASDRVPAPLQLPFQAQPWLPALTGDMLKRSNPALEQWMYAALLLLVALPYGWYTLRQNQIDTAIQHTKQEQTRLTSQAHSLIDARRSALKAQDEINARLQLAPYPTQLDLMTAVAAALPDSASIREWEFQQGKLRIVIAAGLEIPSRADIADALIKSGRFAEVQNLLAREKNSLAFRMTVLPRAGITLPKDARPEQGIDNNG